MNDDLTIVKANSFVQASYSMTLDEMRILALTLGVFDPKNPTKRDFEFTVDEFCKHFPDVDHKSAYTQVQNAIRKISRRWMTLRDDEYVLDEVVFVTDRTYFKKEGRFRIMFHERLMPYIAELHGRYTEYKLINIGALSSTHSIRLYELCSQYRDTGWRQTSLDDLKDWLQVSDKYPRYNSFNQRVLTPAIAEINAKSDLLVDVEPIKRGRKIVALTFKIAKKAKALQAAKIEEKTTVPSLTAEEQAIVEQKREYAKSKGITDPLHVQNLINQGLKKYRIAREESEKAETIRQNEKLAKEQALKLKRETYEKRITKLNTVFSGLSEKEREAVIDEISPNLSQVQKFHLKHLKNQADIFADGYLAELFLEYFNL